MLQHRLTQMLTSLEEMENNIDKRTGNTFNVKSFLRSIKEGKDDESDPSVSDVTQQIGQPFQYRWHPRHTTQHSKVLLAERYLQIVYDQQNDEHHGHGTKKTS